MATIDQLMEAGWRDFQAGDLDRAEQSYRQAVGQDPTAARAWYMLGAIGQMRRRLEEAVGDYQQALRLTPDFPEVWNNLGVALHALRRVEESIAALRQALALRPDYPEAHNNLGNAFRERCDYDQAEACYRRALELKPDYAEAHHNLGNNLKSQGRMAEALERYDRALALRPDMAQVHLSRSLAWLELADFERGWPEYEWRLKCPQFAIPRFPQPRWDGRPLDGGTILLYADHGLGDAIQFIRYAPMVRERSGRVVVVCRAPISRLLATCAGVDLVVIEGGPIPNGDAYAPLMSLPGIFGTDAASIPSGVPYLSADPQLVRSWAEALALPDELCIGIAWQGNPSYSRDHIRSFRLERFAPVACRPGVRLYSLQKGHGSEQIAEFAERFPLTDLGGRIEDLMDSAAVMMNLDLMIVSDTSLAHLAGALGVPSWVALPLEADWRWLSGRDDSPWYPTMRLFRQHRHGDWDEVFARIAAALDEPDQSP
jgi:Flp pilus assembly protein TadD